MFGRHKDQQLASQNSTLHLLKSCSSSICLESLFPSSFTSSTFLKILTSKNRRMRAKRGRRLGDPAFSIDHRVRQELDIVKEELAHQRLLAQNSIQHTANPSQTQRDTLQNYLLSTIQEADISGDINKMSKQTSDLNDKLGLHCNSQQSYQSLLYCFQSILEDQESMSIISSIEQLVPSRNTIKDYRKLFKHLQDIKSSSQFSAKCFEASDSKSSILPSSAYLNTFFSTIISCIRRSIRLVDSESFSTTLNEFQTMQWHFENLTCEERERFVGRLQEDSYWAKMVFLLSRSSKFQKLIEVHLRQRKYQSLLQFFRKIIKGQKAEYQADPCLYDHNQHYRQFILILQRKWIPSTPQPPLQRQLLVSVIKQLQIKVFFHQNYQIEQEFLQKYAIKLSQSLQNQIYKDGIESAIVSLLMDLLNLGQYSKVIAILEQSSKIDPIQALFSVSLLLSLDLSRCQLILYNHQSTISFFINLLEKIFSSTTSCYQLTELLSTFHPIMHLLPNSASTLIHLLTIKDSLFNFILNELSALTYLQTLGLTIENLPSILQSLIKNHASYEYCTMVGMSTCLSVASLMQLIRRESPLSRNRVRYQQTQSRSQQLLRGGERFENFQGIECSHLPYERRLRVLAKFTDIMIKSNSQVRMINVKAAIRSSHLLCLLLQKTYRSLLNEAQQGSNSNNHHFSIIQVHLRTLSFSSALLTLKQCISSSEYQSIVSVLNDFLEQVVPHYQTIHQSLSQTFGSSSALELLEFFSEWTVQGVLLLRQSKPKIVKLNEGLFLEVVRQLMGFVRRCRQYQLQQQEMQRGRSQRSVEEQLEQMLRRIVE